MSSNKRQYISPEPSAHPPAEDMPRLSRKASSYGGSRAWSEEEESYLLESRQHRTPYKHIAQHLQKTELACRLHFHQLAYGTKRKRRSTSASSTTTRTADSGVAAERAHRPNKSIDSTTSHDSLAPPMTQELRGVSPSSSPPAQRRRLARSESPEHKNGLTVQGAGLGALASSVSPRTVFATLHYGHAEHHLYHGADASPSVHSRHSDSMAFASHGELSFQFTGSHSTSTPPPFCGHGQYDEQARRTSGGSGLQTTIQPPSPADLYQIIDPRRLSSIYGAHRQAFWSTVARDYGGNVKATTLEAAFLRQHATSPATSLPTPPCRSPVLVPAVLAKSAPATAVPPEIRISLGGEDGVGAGAGPRFDARACSEEPLKPAGLGIGSGPSAGADDSKSAVCSVANLLTDDQEVWQRRRTV